MKVLVTSVQTVDDGTDIEEVNKLLSDILAFTKVEETTVFVFDDHTTTSISNIRKIRVVD